MDTWLKLDFSNWMLEWEGARTHPAQPPWEQRPKGWWGLAAGLALSRSLRFWLVHSPQRCAAPGSLWEPGELLGGPSGVLIKRIRRAMGFFAGLNMTLWSWASYLSFLNWISSSFKWRQKFISNGIVPQTLWDIICKMPKILLGLGKRLRVN